MRLLVTVFAGLVFSGRTTRPSSTSPIVDATESGECLVQRSALTVKLEQAPSADPYSIQAAAEYLNATAENETSANRTITTSEGLFGVYQHTWSYMAYSLCTHWKVIVSFFIIGFGISFPFMHWTLEHREVERDMFNHSETDGELHKGVVDMLRHIRISRSGGLEKVATLVEVDRPKFRRIVKVLGHLWAIGFNVLMMVQQDVTILKGAEDYYKGLRNDDLPQPLRQYLDFTGNMSLISVRHAACISLAELLGLAAMLIWIFYRVVVFRLNKNSKYAKYDAYLSLHEIFHGLCLLGGFSALRVLSIIHPALFMRQFQWNTARPFLGRKWASGYGMQVAYFVITRICAIFLGVLAFGVKLAFTSVQIHLPLAAGENWLWAFCWKWMVVMMLLEQTLGAIAVEHVMWWRIILVIVEGGDRKISLEKIQVMYVYLSRIMQSIHEEYWEKGQYIRYFVLMLTFDHIDLQHLLIDETAEGISSSLSSCQFRQMTPGGEIEDPDYSDVHNDCTLL